MNFIRSVISFFLLILLGLTIAGWIWAGGLPAPNATGARVALGLCSLMAVGTMVILWTTKQPDAP